MINVDKECDLLSRYMDYYIGYQSSWREHFFDIWYYHKYYGILLYTVNEGQNYLLTFSQWKEHQVIIET